MASHRKASRIARWIIGLPLPFILTADAANHRVGQVKEALPDYMSLADALERSDFVQAVGFVAGIIGCAVIVWWFTKEVGHMVGSLYTRWPWRGSSATADVRPGNDSSDQNAGSSESPAVQAPPATVVVEVPSRDPVSSVIVTVAPSATLVRLEVLIGGLPLTSGAGGGSKAAKSIPMPSRARRIG